MEALLLVSLYVWGIRSTVIMMRCCALAQHIYVIHMIVEAVRGSFCLPYRLHLFLGKFR